MSKGRPSVAQALADIDPGGAVAAVAQEQAGADAERNTLRFELPCLTGRAVAVTLRLERADTQPRPAWISLNGTRVDRRIAAGYEQSLVAADGRQQALPDPLHALVYRFALPLTRRRLDDTRPFARAIATRLRCFAGIVAALDA